MGPLGASRADFQGTLLFEIAISGIHLQAGNKAEVWCRSELGKGESERRNLLPQNSPTPEGVLIQVYNECATSLCGARVCAQFELEMLCVVDGSRARPREILGGKPIPAGPCFLRWAEMARRRAELCVGGKPVTSSTNCLSNINLTGIANFLQSFP